MGRRVATDTGRFVALVAVIMAVAIALRAVGVSDVIAIAVAVLLAISLLDPRSAPNRALRRLRSRG